MTNQTGPEFLPDPPTRRQFVFWHTVLSCVAAIAMISAVLAVENPAWDAVIFFTWGIHVYALNKSMDWFKQMADLLLIVGQELEDRARRDR